MTKKELTHKIAVMLDYPSLYMGGPSYQNTRRAVQIVDVLEAENLLDPEWYEYDD